MSEIVTGSESTLKETREWKDEQEMWSNSKFETFAVVSLLAD